MTDGNNNHRLWHGRQNRKKLRQYFEGRACAGLLRPITLYPFPEKEYKKLAQRKDVKMFYCFELSMGQMVEDVRLSVDGKKPTLFYGRTGGNVISPEDIVKAVKSEVK